MKYGGFQTIHSCKEYDAVNISMQDMLGDNGRLNIYPEVAGKGYFDIDYKQGALTLKATRYIGLIPINDKLSIHVEPRAPVSNLMWMIARAGTQINGLSGFIRGYQEQIGTLEAPEAMYFAAFHAALRQVSETGILRRFVMRITDRELRGRLLMGPTIGRFRSRGVFHQAAFEVHDITENNPENQIIKHTAERILRYFALSATTEMRKIAEQLRILLQPFAMVESGSVNADFVARSTPQLIRALPHSHRFYEPVLWLSYLISTNSGVTMERIGQTRFDTIILDAAAIFERYIRRVIQESTGQLGNCIIVDGNEKPVNLFMDGGSALAKPDYYFVIQNKAVAVADAKYKPRAKISASDRYELLAFCDALSVTKAAFIVPAYEGQTLYEHYGVTHGGRTITFVGINLAAKDIADEEIRFIQRLSDALSLA